MKILLSIFLLSSFIWAECSVFSLRGDFSSKDSVRLISFLGKNLDEIFKEDSLKWENAKRAIIRNYEDNGFPGAILEEICEKDTLEIWLRRGEGFVFAEAKNALSMRTRPAVFSRLSGLENGAPFSLRNTERAKIRFERTGYFSLEKETKLYREESRNRIVPLFFMREISQSYAEGFVSYSGEDNLWVANIDVSLKNIAGTARDLKIFGAGGEGVREISFAYKEPWLFHSNWNGLLRGRLEDDSLASDALLELGVSRSVSFEWDISLFGGIGDDEWITSLEVDYWNEDAYRFPRRGSSLEASVRIKKNRHGEKREQVSVASAWEHFTPLFGDFISRIKFSAGSFIPSSKTYPREDLFRLGGALSWKGFRPDFLRTRSYADAEYALRFQGISNTALEVFYQPGIYRNESPLSGFSSVHQYGLGIIQYRDSFSVSIYYALRPKVTFAEGLLHLGVRTLF